MRKIFGLLFGLAVAASAHFQLDSFQVYVDSVVPGSRYGLSIRSVKTGAELGNIRGVEKFTPASTLKTLPTATALNVAKNAMDMAMMRIMLSYIAS